jgi:hypothetical protein
MSSQMKAQVDKLLTNVSLQVPSQGLVADEVLPKLVVDQYTGLIGKYGEEHLRAENDLGGGRHEFRRVDPIDYKAGHGYSIEDHGLEDLVTKRDLKNIEDPFDAESDKVTGLTQKVMISKEIKIASLMTNTSILTKNVTLSGTSQFSDYNNSKPLTVFKNAHQSHITELGIMANTAVMSLSTFNTLKYHPEILEKLGFNNVRAGLITKEELARAMDIDNLLIAQGIVNNAKKGQSKTIGSIWGKDIVFYFKPQGPAKGQISLGYKLNLRGEESRQVRKYYIDNPGATAIIVEESYDYQITMPEAGYLIKNAIA